MKKQYWMAAAIMTVTEILLFGCGVQPLAAKTEVTNRTNIVAEEVKTQKETQVEKKQQSEKTALKRMIMLDGKLYVETGETNSLLRCGTMDGTITSTTDGEKPKKDGQSNFGKDIGFQYGMRENRIEVCLDNVWQIFAYNENNLEGVSMTVKDIKNTGGTVVINNASDSEITFGEDFLLEKLDAKTNEWILIPIVVEGEWGYHLLGYPVNSGEVRDWELDWTWLYGEIEPGEYRLVKYVFSEKKSEGMRTEGTGSSVKYTLTYEFTVNESQEQ